MAPRSPKPRGRSAPGGIPARLVEELRERSRIAAELLEVFVIHDIDAAGLVENQIQLVTVVGTLVARDVLAQELQQEHTRSGNKERQVEELRTERGRKLDANGNLSEVRAGCSIAIERPAGTERAAGETQASRRYGSQRAAD